MSLEMRARMSLSTCLFVIALSALGAAGCSGRSGIDERGGTMSDIPRLPIVKPFALDRTGSTFESAIAVPEMQKGQAQEVMIGFRVAVGTEPFERLAILKQAQIPVVVRVTRETPQGDEPVPLFMQHYVPDEGLLPIPVGAAGLANRKSGMVNADGGALLDAGYPPGSGHLEFAFVTFEPPAPGRYTVSLRTLGERPKLEGFATELVIAYARLGK